MVFSIVICGPVETQILVLVNKMVVLPSNTVLVFMILVLLSVPSLNQSEKDEMSPICDDKTHFENGHRISFSSLNNSSNNFSNGNFRINNLVNYPWFPKFMCFKTSWTIQKLF